MEQQQQRQPSGEGGNQAVATADGGVEYYSTGKWAALYPDQEVAVVTSIGRPPLPPDGYVPLRYGLPRPARTETAAGSNNNAQEDDDAPQGFSLDTLLWNEKLLEERIMELTEWTRRAPLAPREKLARINRMINRCTTTNNQVAS